MFYLSEAAGAARGGGAAEVAAELAAEARRLGRAAAETEASLALLRREGVRSAVDVTVIQPPLSIFHV